MRSGLIGIALAAMLLAGCVADALNTSASEAPTYAPQVTVLVPADIFLDSVWTVTWTGGIAPYNIEMDMGGGMVENVPAGTPATSPFVAEFTSDYTYVGYDVDYTYTVTVTDSYGNAGAQSGHYSTIIGNDPPNIESVTYSDQVLTVVVSDYDDLDYLAVTVTEPPGLRVDTKTKHASQDTRTAVFYWKARNILVGGVGETTIYVHDGTGAQDRAFQMITIDPVFVPSGALAVIPANSRVVEDQCEVLVVSGAFDSLAPFQYMNGVGVTVDAGATYVDGTLNVGAPGGDQLTPDGLWADMSPVPDSFLIPSDFMIQENDIGAGRVRIDFNVTPIGGGNTTTGGALFNFGLEFDHAGTYTLGFEEFHDVKRTYYSDTDSNQYNWDDISNDYTDVPNSIEVI